MKFKFDISHIILIVVIALFFRMWLTKSSTVIQDVGNEAEHLKTILMQKVKIRNADLRLDSITDLYNLELENNKVLQEKLETFNTVHDEEIDIINNQFITDDIKLFRANFLSDSRNN